MSRLEMEGSGDLLQHWRPGKAVAGEGCVSALPGSSVGRPSTWGPIGDNADVYVVQDLPGLIRVRSGLAMSGCRRTRNPHPRTSNVTNER
jgi:hypothetical protein